jgi:hypothetical protein
LLDHRGDAIPIEIVGAASSSRPRSTMLSGPGVLGGSSMRRRKKSANSLHHSGVPFFGSQMPFSSHSSK